MTHTAHAVVPSPHSFAPQPRLSAAEALARIHRFVEDWRMQTRDKPGGFAGFEKELHAKVMEFEREVIAEDMAHADLDVEAIVVEGDTYRRVVRCEETYFTAAGPVHIERTLYKDRTDETGRAICPMDLRLGIVEGRWTPLAAQQVTWVVAQMTPQLAEELFARMGNMSPSKSSLDRLPKALSARWEEERVHFEKALRAEDIIPPHTTTVAVSLDGVLAPMKDGQAQPKRQKTAEQGRLTRGPAGYREIGCGTLSFCDAKGDMIAAVRMARMPESKKSTLKRTLLADVTAVLAAPANLVLVKLTDGAEDNWTFLSEQMPEGTEIVDFFHASEHLNAALASVYGDGTVEARRRFEDLRFVLKEEPEGIEKVICSLDYLRKKHPRNERLTKELAYFRKQRYRMRYHQFVAEGLPIGSGVVEAACKTLVTQRMKQSGMRWGQEGGQAILTMRGCDAKRRPLRSSLGAAGRNLSGRGHRVAQCGAIPAGRPAKEAVMSVRARVTPFAFDALDSILNTSTPRSSAASTRHVEQRAYAEQPSTRGPTSASIGAAPFVAPPWLGACGNCNDSGHGHLGLRGWLE